MRILEFNIEGQTLSKDKKCDFDKIIIGSRGYLKLHFNFEPQWKDLNKIVVFKGLNGEMPYKIIDDEIMIPDNMTDNTAIVLWLIGFTDKIQISTNKIRIKQERM